MVQQPNTGPQGALTSVKMIHTDTHTEWTMLPPKKIPLTRRDSVKWRAFFGEHKLEKIHSLSDIMAEPYTLPGKPLKPCLLPEKDHVVLLHKRHEVTWC